jgi:membrane associated rhomboid family serine protease
MSITLIIVGITAITSFMAFSNHKFIDELIFWPYRIWRNKEWYRVLSCGFIHADTMHLLFNMIALYSFGVYVETEFANIFHGKGLMLYLLLYFMAITIADIYNLFTKKDDYNYRSLGASGGVSAIVFASILLNPFGQILIFFAIPIPALIFGPLYIIYCIYMAKRGSDNIGHMAHFTGSIFGFVFPIIFAPGLLSDFLQQITNHISHFKP